MTGTLPYPTSTNPDERMWRGRMVISARGRAFREEVGAILAPKAERGGNGPRKPPAGGRVALCMDDLPSDRRRDFGSSSARRIDWSLN